MHIDHVAGREAFVSELTLLLQIAGSLGDRDLLAASRCRGWTVADVLTHVHLGLQEMLLGIVSPTDAAPTVDAASYWSQAPADNDEASGTDHVRYVRLLTSAYQRPSGSIRHLTMTGRTLVRAVTSLPPTSLDFQGHVIDTGDFLATWAVELAVHHLDLGLELIVDPPTPAARDLTRRTVETLAGGPFPATLSEQDVILIGTGRKPTPDADALAHLTIPALG